MIHGFGVTLPLLYVAGLMCLVVTSYFHMITTVVYVLGYPVFFLLRWYD